MKDFMCNSCEKQFDTDKQMVAHYRKSHPDDAYGLWGAIGTTGDAFADNLVNYYFNQYRAADKKLRQTAVSSVNQMAFDDLLAKAKRLADKLEIIRLTASV